MVKYLVLKRLIGEYMSFDTISDMFCSLNNAVAVQKKVIQIPKSKLKIQILEFLKNENIISEYEVKDNTIFVSIFYNKGLSTFKKISKVSKSSLRVYKKKNELLKSISKSYFFIVSTSKLGITKDITAVKNNIGGEIIGKVI